MQADLLNERGMRGITEDIAMETTAQEMNRNPARVIIERPNSTSPDIYPVNGNYGPEDEDEEEEDDLILGDEDEAFGDEEEFDVELEEDIGAVEIDEDDLVIDPDDIDDDDEDDDL